MNGAEQARRWLMKFLRYKVPVYLILVGYIAMVVCLAVIQSFASSSQPCPSDEASAQSVHR